MNDIAFSLAAWELPPQEPTRRQRWAMHRFNVPNDLIVLMNRDQAERMLDLLIEIVKSAPPVEKDEARSDSQP